MPNECKIFVYYDTSLISNKGDKHCVYNWPKHVPMVHLINVFHYESAQKLLLQTFSKQNFNKAH